MLWIPVLSLPLCVVVLVRESCWWSDEWESKRKARTRKRVEKNTEEEKGRLRKVHVTYGHETMISWL